MKSDNNHLVLVGRNLHKTFRRQTGEIVTALDNVSLEVASGTLAALVGPDGAGKTTLIRLAAGLMFADEGELNVLGINVAADPQRVQDRIGYMPQKFGLYEDLTVQENLDLYADLHGVTENERRERYPRLMEMTALGPFSERLAGKLSGGMKQKLGLACTLVRSPELLLLDEPTVGVDPLSRRELWEIILQLVKEQSLTVIVSTSYLDEAERCDHVAVLHEGKVLAHSEPREVSALAENRVFVIDPPAGELARKLQARLLDDPQIVDAVPEGGRVRFVLKDSGKDEGGRMKEEGIKEESGGMKPESGRMKDESGRMNETRNSELGTRNPAAAAEDEGGGMKDEGGRMKAESGRMRDEGGRMKTETASLLKNSKVTAVAPQFEDGFMVLLRRSSEKETWRQGEKESAPDKETRRRGDGETDHSESLSPGLLVSLSSIPVSESPSLPVSLSPSLPTSPADPVVEVRDLVRCFGSFTAVDHVSFRVYRGEIFGLLGPNGAGKTTTFRMLCGLLPATSGTLRVAGMDLRRARAEARQRIGYVAQKFSLYGQLSVAENLEFFASAYGLRAERKRQRINWALHQFELASLERLPSGQLPGGYKQRLAMAAALLHEPETLFLDEPTSGVDPLARREFWRRITALAEQGVTVIVTTHFMEEAEYCDRIVIMDAGRVLAQGTPAEIRRGADHDGSGEPSMEEAFIRIVEKAREHQAHATEPGAAA